MMPRDAATVILVRQGAADPLEVFFMRRNRNQSFMAGAFVFPGGALDPGIVMSSYWISAKCAKRKCAICFTSRSCRNPWLAGCLWQPYVKRLKKRESCWHPAAGEDYRICGSPR